MSGSHSLNPTESKRSSSIFSDLRILSSVLFPLQIRSVKQLSWLIYLATWSLAPKTASLISRSFAIGHFLRERGTLQTLSWWKRLLRSILRYKSGGLKDDTRPSKPERITSLNTKLTIGSSTSCPMTKSQVNLKEPRSVLLYLMSRLQKSFGRQRSEVFEGRAGGVCS